MKRHTLTAVIPLLIFSCSIFNATLSQAELVTVNLTLVPVAPPTNQLLLTLAGGEDTTDMMGNITAEIDIDLETGEVSSLLLTGGAIVTTDWAMSTVVGDVTGTNVLSTTNTNSVPSLVFDGDFLPSQHEMVLNGGIVEAAGAGFLQDFAVDPSTIPGVDTPGAGSIVVTMNPGGFYDLLLTLPIDDVQELAPGANITITGNLVAQGQTEPTGTVAGDANGDGSFDFGDIEAFFLAITDLGAYTAQYPNVMLNALDMNADGNTDFGDIEPFFVALTAG